MLLVVEFHESANKLSYLERKIRCHLWNCVRLWDESGSGWFDVFRQTVYVESIVLSSRSAKIRRQSYAFGHASSKEAEHQPDRALSAETGAGHSFTSHPT